MKPAAKRYRIPCRCSEEVLVGPGQAGGQVVCPACGAAVDVPRLRDLEPFATVDSGPAPKPWRACHAWLLAGTAVALVSAAAAMVVGTRALARPALLPDPAMIRTAVDAADPITIYKAWRALRVSGVDRGPLPEEARLQREVSVAARVGGMLWLVSALGAAVAAAAGLACLAGPRAAALATAARDDAAAGGARA
ncbi:MAG: hypothetical protein ACKOCX_01050 [Planctomycetota bacterium]